MAEKSCRNPMLYSTFMIYPNVEYNTQAREDCSFQKIQHFPNLSFKKVQISRDSKLCRTQVCRYFQLVSIEAAEKKSSPHIYGDMKNYKKAVL